MKFINGSVYWHGAGRISSCLNRLRHEVLGCAAAISLMIFCKVKIFPLSVVTANKYSKFYNRMKVWIVTLFDGGHVTDMVVMLLTW
jgi:hypothetical protein